MPLHNKKPVLHPQLRLGTRVMYRIPPGGMGNTDLEGRTGTVIYIDGTVTPYTVRLDEPYMDAVSEMRIRSKDATECDWRGYRIIPNCWFCQAENLVPIPGELPEEVVKHDPAGWRRTQNTKPKPMTVITRKKRSPGKE